MRSSFGAPLAALGLILASVTIAYFAGSASYGPTSGRISGGRLLIIGCWLAGLGMLGLSIAPQWWLVPAVAGLVGGGSGLIDASLNTHVSLHRGIRYMGWLHASWAAGAAIAPPLVVASVALTGSWRAAFAAAGAAFLGCGGLAAYQRRQWTPSRPPAIASSAAPSSRSNNRRLAAIVLAGLFLVGAGFEATSGNWSFTQLTLGRGLGASLAGVAASLFWVGLAAGRVALGLLGHRVAATRLLDASLVGCAVAALIFWVAPTVLAAFVALPLLGLSASLIFPLLLSMTPERVGTAMTGHTVGYGLAAGTLGGGGIPALAGLILQGVGLWTLGPILTALAAILWLVNRVNRKPTSGV